MSTPPSSDDQQFLYRLADLLAALPGITAVSLGGSRAEGTHRVDSDWDLAIYYRERFDPEDLRALELPGEVSDIGGWSSGVFNGGAWLTVEGRSVDVHYRDLNVVERELDRAERGDFDVEPLLFHLAGIPSYLVVGELAINSVLRGELPRPVRYPEALRGTAPRRWQGTAQLVLGYAKGNFAAHGRLTETAGSLATAAAQAAHGVLAARGEWVTNEKRLLERAGMREMDRVIAGLTPDATALVCSVEAAEEQLARAAVA